VPIAAGIKSDTQAIMAYPPLKRKEQKAISGQMEDLNVPQEFDAVPPVSPVQRVELAYSIAFG